MVNSIPHDTFFKVIVVCISPGRFGSSNLSVWRMRSTTPSLHSTSSPNSIKPEALSGGIFNVTDVLRLIHERADTREPVYTADVIAAWPPDLFEQVVSSGILTATANASAVVCDACAGDHVEEVLYMQSPSNTELRAYIRCPEEGRVFVPLDRLRRWEVNYRCVARLAASALSASGEVEEVVPSCVWLLGKVSLGSRRYKIFLGRRLTGRANRTENPEKQP
jgi:hypothetical protein